ncbi:cytochrome c oxidase assembly protein [Rhizobium leguminosarum]|uniref:cytochrome c oxidase assembly protein n=1 Tax=Rhizobium leguminosarum TaxID=384 RepID=UPI001C9572A0|nr:cytochrome c oxidase assembly protein [Rhizobium leguminosarum]MBY5572149.1 cytochrome c oxidase assembly protein [Rhizobium leguminosarum]MBY5578754.1 cytochrome c oxidase assembly protein [Rhizobium leguminosarum]
MSDWNFNPYLLLAIGITAALTWLPARRDKRVGQRLVAIAIFTVAFVSPLCALSSALFSARAVHHIVLISLVAPLVWPFVFSREKALGRVPPMVVFALHTTMLWLWHLPLPYAWALSGNARYWLMEAPLFLSAMWLWKEMLDPRRPAGGALVVCAATLLHMTALGAFLTFASHPLFSPHFLTSQAYGLSPIEDQQLAGLLMWVPASLPFATAFLFRIARAITRSSAGVPARGPAP